MLRYKIAFTTGPYAQLPRTVQVPGQDVIFLQVKWGLLPQYYEARGSFCHAAVLLSCGSASVMRQYMTDARIAQLG